MVVRPRMDEADPPSWMHQQMPVFRALGADGAGDPIGNVSNGMSRTGWSGWQNDEKRIRT